MQLLMVLIAGLDGRLLTPISLWFIFRILWQNLILMSDFLQPIVLVN